jgi:hypothetical protein
MNLVPWLYSRRHGLYYGAFKVHGTELATN